MTIEELRAELARRRGLGLEYIALMIPGDRRGARARVIPGVMGRVVGPTHDGKGTIVDVRVADVERALARGAAPAHATDAERAHAHARGTK